MDGASGASMALAVVRSIVRRRRYARFAAAAKAMHAPAGFGRVERTRLTTREANR